MAIIDTKAIGEFLTGAMDKIWPDPSDKASAEAMLMKAATESVVDKLNAQQAVMLAEANSEDKWTSRARPSFLYVVYILLLSSIPMGIVYAVDPKLAADLTTGMKNWFDALPDKIVELFMYVMLGYVGARSIEKVKKS